MCALGFMLMLTTFFFSTLGSLEKIRLVIVAISRQYNACFWLCAYADYIFFFFFFFFCFFPWRFGKDKTCDCGIF